MQELTDVNPARRAFIDSLTLVSLADGRAELACAPAHLAGAKARSETLADLLRRATGSPVQVALRAIETRPQDAPAEPEESVEVHDSIRPAEAAEAEHPLVQLTAELFGATVTDIRPKDRPKERPKDGPKEQPKG